MDTKNIGEGFWRSDAWPYYFMVNRPPRHPVLTLWGFSIWKNSPGYRTFGNYLSKWLADHPNAKIERDTDRTLDKVFLRDWRAKTRAAKGGA